MQRRLCEMSEAKWSITEAKCLQISHNKYASQRDAISHSMGNLMLSHSAGMHNTDKSIAGISKRFHFASLHYIFSAYLPTHIKFLTEFHRIFFGTTCISFPTQNNIAQRHRIVLYRVVGRLYFYSDYGATGTACTFFTVPITNTLCTEPIDSISPKRLSTKSW